MEVCFKHIYPDYLEIYASRLLLRHFKQFSTQPYRQVLVNAVVMRREQKYIPDSKENILREILSSARLSRACHGRNPRLGGYSANLRVLQSYWQIHTDLQEAVADSF